MHYNDKVIQFNYCLSPKYAHFVASGGLYNNLYFLFWSTFLMFLFTILIIIKKIIYKYNT